MKHESLITAVYTGPAALEARFETFRGEIPPRHPLTPFIAGYFAQKAGRCCEDKEKKTNLFKQSLAHYQSFLSSKHRAGRDILYYTQWQIGVLQESLGHRWSEAEESYLTALEYDPGRAEALREVLIHQYLQKNWYVALIYSTYCKDQFLGKVPPKRYWGLNLSFYQWKILKYHLAILLHLQKQREAESCLNQLLQLANKHGADLSEKDLKDISMLKESCEKTVSI